MMMISMKKKQKHLSSHSSKSKDHNEDKLKIMIGIKTKDFRKLNQLKRMEGSTGLFGIPLGGEYLDNDLVG